MRLEGRVDKVYAYPEVFGKYAALKDKNNKTIYLTNDLGTVKLGDCIKTEGSFRENSHFMFDNMKVFKTIPDDIYSISAWLYRSSILSIEEIADLVAKYKLSLVDRIFEGKIEEVSMEKLQELRKYVESETALIKVSEVAHELNVKDTEIDLLIRSKTKEEFEDIVKNPYKIICYTSEAKKENLKDIAKNSDDKLKIQVALQIASRLDEARNMGNTAVCLQEMLMALSVEFALPMGIIESAIQKEGMFSIFHGKIQFEKDSIMERAIATKLIEMRSTSKHEIEPGLIQKLEEELGYSLATQQKQAVLESYKNNLMIITGGPGTGKTTTTKAVIKLLKRSDLKIMLVAPTGKAAKRMEQSTGLPAKTIHKLLGYDGSFYRTKTVETDVLIIDESSMVDFELFYNLLEAVGSNTKIIILGDIDQLPSVGPGQILRDLIESGEIPCVKLTEIFRQAADSTIITNAYLINDAKEPLYEESKDFSISLEQDNTITLKKTIELYKDLLRSNDISEVQILLPMYNGKLGIDSINKIIQSEVNTSGDSGVEYEGTSYKINDKVIQLSNNAEKDICNGDIGIIKETDSDAQSIEVQFEGKEDSTVLEGKELDDLKHAYAITIHKSQGSEYRHVILPMSMEQKCMLKKNLFYTAVTRGKEKVHIIGQREAIKFSAMNTKDIIRCTNLKEYIRAEAEKQKAHI